MDTPGDTVRQPDPVTEQLISDLQASMPQRLSDDLAAVDRLGRGGATADPDLPPEQLVSELRRQADGLTFESPAAAVTAALRHAAELPYAERGAEEPFGPYHASASLTVTDGEMVREWLGADASVELVFQREAHEANATAVLLEAVVRVSASGSVTLTSYGSPIRAVNRPGYRFDGEAEGYLRQMVSDLAAADQTPRAFERAMLMAYGVAVAQRRRAPVPDGVIQAAQRQVLGLVVERLSLLGRYLEQAINLPARGGVSGWFAGCVRRSAAESLFEGFLGSATFELIERDALTELAEAIGEAAQGIPAPTRGALVPAGTPASHTWWS